MGNDTFDVLILIGRPASGKSEIIHHLKHTPPDIRREAFHIAAVDVLDDFPLLWAWFEEDHILAERLGQPRLHTDSEGYFKHPYLWHVLIERLGLEYGKRVRDVPSYHATTTTVVEFSRGSEHGGYTEAFAHLSGDLLTRAAVVYVRVPFEESLRKNRRRFNPDRPDSILEHGLPDEKMERLYRDDDWETFSGGSDLGHLTVHSIDVPFAVLANEDDVTSSTPELLGARLEDVLGQLWAQRRG
jgi:hypothetical protein